MQAIMRKWAIGDAASLFEVYNDTPDLVRQIGPISDLAAADDLLDGYRSAWDANTGWVWAIAVQDRIVGSVGVTSINWRHRTGWCWYWLGRTARGNGLASRALATAAVEAFTDDLYRLELAHRTNNPASCAVATNAGFAVEGIERAKLEYEGVRFDCETHARLATDPRPDIELLEVV